MIGIKLNLTKYQKSNQEVENCVAKNVLHKSSLIVENFVHTQKPIQSLI